MNLREKYQKTISKKLKDDLKIANIHDVPRLKKVVVNVGIGKAKEDSKLEEIVKKDLAAITGQIPSPRGAKKSISGFKVREGLIVGMAVTLRGERMYHFIDKLINITLPRIRDFKGLNNKSFDQVGNYSLGISEQIIFPEIKYEEIEKIYPLEITIVTNTNNKDYSKELLKSLGFPFKK